MYRRRGKMTRRLKTTGATSELQRGPRKEVKLVFLKSNGANTTFIYSCHAYIILGMLKFITK
jgi:hypothetical protein